MRRCGPAPLALAAVLCACAPAHADALRISDHYSPRNAERPRRASTDLIILHTTEGPSRGSLNKVHANGEAHYFVQPDGKVLRIIDRNRIAFHAGRSMWDGRTNLDTRSIGIEIVGYHNSDITSRQYAAVKELLSQLQRIYGVPDARVLTHSMIAYGAPNRWHRKSHRGRKRCGMLFARIPVRRRLGLTDEPRFDPDVRAGRLVNADPALAQVLYGSREEQESAAARYVSDDADVISPRRSAWDIARDQYNRAETLYIFPDGERRHGNEIADWRRMPAGTRVVMSGATACDNPGAEFKEIGIHGENAVDIAGEEAGHATTIYFLPDGGVKKGDELSGDTLAALPAGTRMLVGYVYGGYVQAGRSAFDICGAQWNCDTTFYRFSDGSIRPGSEIREAAIPANTLVFFQN